MENLKDTVKLYLALAFEGDITMADGFTVFLERLGKKRYSAANLKKAWDEYIESDIAQTDFINAISPFGKIIPFLSSKQKLAIAKEIDAKYGTTIAKDRVEQGLNSLFFREKERIEEIRRHFMEKKLNFIELNEKRKAAGLVYLTKAEIERKFCWERELKARY